MNTKAKPTQYGPTRNRLTKQQGLQLRGPAELAAGELISPAAACRILNDNQAGLYVAEGRISSWICEKLIPSQSYTARDGRSCALLFVNHVEYLKKFLLKISSEEPTKRAREAETRKAARPAEPAKPAAAGSPAAETAGPAGDVPGQKLFQFDQTDPARAVFDVLNINARVAAIEKALNAGTAAATAKPGADHCPPRLADVNRLDALEKTLKTLTEKVSALNERISVLYNADGARQFALKELWEHVADLRKEQMRRIAGEEAEHADRLEAETRELIGA